jgi:hypothetical protein
MKNKQQFDERVEAVLNSLDGATSAMPKSFLLTRINARLHAKQESIWDKYLYFISRPAIAFAAVCMVIVINIFAITNGNSANAIVAEDIQNTYMLDDDDVASNTIIIDNENVEP